MSVATIDNIGGGDKGTLKKACFVASGWAGAAQDIFLFGDDGTVTANNWNNGKVVEDENFKIVCSDSPQNYTTAVYAKKLGTVKVVKYTEYDHILTNNEVVVSTTNQSVLALSGKTSAPYNFGIGFVQYC